VALLTRKHLNLALHAAERVVVLVLAAIDAADRADPRSVATEQF
jgi:hypothetical protein